MMKRSALTSNAPYLALILAVALPIFMRSHEIWDGVIIEYASLTADYSGIHAWFVESGWFLQYWFTAAILELSRLSGLPYVQLMHLLVVLLLALLVRETMLLSERILGLPAQWRMVAGLLVVLFPIWSVLSSGVMSFHLACFAVGLLAVRLLHSSTGGYMAAGLLLAFPAFNFQSLLVFLPVLSYAYDINSQAGKPGLKPSARTLSIFAAGVVFFCFSRVYFPPHGIYEGYNQLAGNGASGIERVAKSILRAGYGVVRFGTFAVPALILAASIGYATLRPAPTRSATALALLKAAVTDRRIIALILLSGAAVFPYVAVGKSAAIVDIKDWSGRQAMLLAVPLALLSSYLFFLIHRQMTLRAQRLSIAALLVLIAVSWLGLWVGFAEKVHRGTFETKLVETVRSELQDIEPGLLQIVGEGIPGPAFRHYEGNILMYRALNRADWWVHVGERIEADLQVPVEVLERREIQQTYIYLPASAAPPCTTIVEIEARGFEGAAAALKTLLGLPGQSSIEVVNRRKSCPPAADNSA